MNEKQHRRPEPVNNPFRTSWPGCLLKIPESLDLYLSEFHLYGSGRLGVDNVNTRYDLLPNDSTFTKTYGKKSYELVNHLGNVLANISDRKHSVDEGHYDPAQGWLTSPDGIADYFEPTILSSHDYYPFGMQMPGRSYETSGYRFGFNGQEKVDEIVGAGNHYNAPFWEYDPRVVHRWNTDPKPNLTFSPYAINQGNPIWYSDPLGDTLNIGGKKRIAKRDVYSMVSEKYQDRISFDKTRVNFDATGLSNKEIEADAGLKLLIDLTTAKEKYQYSVSNKYSIKVRSTAKIIKHNMFDNSLKVSNVSVTPRMETGKGPAGSTTVGDYDAELTIAPIIDFYERDASGTLVKKSRASIVFHELQESFERTTHKLPYLYVDPSDPTKEHPTKKGAHGVAVDKESKFHMKSHQPGNAIQIIHN